MLSERVLLVIFSFKRKIIFVVLVVFISIIVAIRTTTIFIAFEPGRKAFAIQFHAFGIAAIAKLFVSLFL